MAANSSSYYPPSSPWPGDGWSVQYSSRYKGIEIDVDVKMEPSGLPWDGDYELPPNAEGYDLSVQVDAHLDGAVVSAGDSLGSVWIVPDQEGIAYLDDQLREVVDEALAQLEQEIRAIAEGREVRLAQTRQRAAKEWVQKNG